MSWLNWMRGPLREEENPEDWAGGGGGEEFTENPEDFAGGGEDPDPKAEPKEEPKGKAKDDGVSLSKREYDALHRRLGELEESERYWAEQAKRGGKPAKDDAEDDDALDLSDKSVVDEFSERGIEALVKRGVLTARDAKDLIAKEVRRSLDGERAKLEKDAALLSEFTDLNNPKSDLSVRTAKVFQEMVADDPDLKGSAGALKAAAKAAAAELRAERGREDDRDARIRRQAGDGARGSRDYRESDNVSPLAMRFAREMGLDPKMYEAGRKNLGGRR